MISYKNEEIDGKNLTALLSRNDIRKIEKNIEIEDEYKLELEVSKKHGQKAYMHGTINSMDEQGEKEHYMFVLCDISDRKTLENKVNYLDSYDSLPNRDFMEREFTSILPELNRQRKRVAL